MENNTILSIIIPFYNVEDYIERCLNSILTQNVSSELYEVIAINDGSKDGSLEIAERIAKEHSNIIVISQENKGQSAARNHGVRIAKGDYIWYVDSDDWIEDGCLTKILNIINGSEVELYTFGHKNWFDGEIVEHPHVKGKIDVWCVEHLYKRSFLIKNNIWFIEGIFHEDVEYCPRVSVLAKTNIELDMTPYIIYKRPGSTTTACNPKKAFDLLVAARSLDDFQKSHQVFREIITPFIALSLNSSLQNVHIFKMDEENERKLNQAFYENRDLWISLWKSGILKYKIEFLIFCLFKKHCVQAFKVMQFFNMRDFNRFKKMNNQ